MYLKSLYVSSYPQYCVGYQQLYIITYIHMISIITNTNRMLEIMLVIKLSMSFVRVCVCCFKNLCLSNLQFALIKHQWFVGQCPPKIPKEVSTCYVSCSLLKLCFFLLVHPHLCCWLNLISTLFWLKEAGTSTEYVEKRIRRIPLIRKQIINK